MLKRILLFTSLAALLIMLPFWPRGTEATHTDETSEGAIFPNLTGKSLAGQDVSIPQKNGKSTLLGIAFSQKAESDLKGWIQPLYDTFLAKREGVFEAGNFDGNVYLVALLSGAASLAGKGLQDKVAKGTDAELRPHILLATQAPDAILKALAVTDKNKPYFVVLDKEGHIQSVVSGSYSEAKMDELSEKAGEAE